MGDHGKLLRLSLSVLILWSFIIPLESRFLAIFRPRSRHTSTILPLEVWELPLQELKHCYCFNDFDVDYSVATFNESSLKETCYLFEPTSPAAVKEVRRLIAAASRCVLLHGLYELWANSDNIQSAVETCTHIAAQLTKKDAYYDVAAGVIGNPYITNDDLQRTVLSHFDPLFTSSPDNESVAASLDSDKDKENYLCAEKSTIAHSGPSSVPIPIRIYVDDLTGRCIVGRLLATGTVTHHYCPL